MRIFHGVFVFIGIVACTHAMEQQPITLEIQQQTAQNFVVKYKDYILRFNKLFVRRLHEVLDDACRAEERGDEVCKLFINNLGAGQVLSFFEFDPMLLDSSFIRLWSKFCCAVPGPRAKYFFCSRGSGPFRSDDNFLGPQSSVRLLVENTKNFITVVLNEIEKNKVN